GRLVRALLQGEKNHAQHFVPRCRFAGPDFELAGRLMDEHLDAGDDLRAAFLGQFQEPGFGRIVNHVKYIAGIDLFFLQRRVARISHANGSGVDDHIEGQLLQIGALHDASMGLVRQFPGWGRTAVEDVNFRAPLFETEHRRAGCASSSDYQNAGAFERVQPAFQRPDDPGGVGVEAVKLAVLRANYRIAGADLGGVGVGIVQMRQDRLFVGHGHADAVNGDLPHARKQVFQGLGVQGKVDGIHVFAAEGGVHDGRRKRMGDRVYDHSVDARGGVQLLDPVDTAQLLGRRLARSGGFPGGGGGESEDAPCSYSQDAANEPLLSHAHADQGMTVALTAQKLDHGDVVGKRGRGADDFIKVGGISQHSLQRLVELLGCPEIVERKDQGRSGAQLLKLLRLALAGGLQLDVDQLASG